MAKKYIARGKGTFNDAILQGETMPVASVESAVAHYLYAFGRIPDIVLDEDDRPVWRGKHRGPDARQKP